MVKNTQVETKHKQNREYISGWKYIILSALFIGKMEVDFYVKFTEISK